MQVLNLTQRQLKPAEDFCQSWEDKLRDLLSKRERGFTHLFCTSSDKGKMCFQLSWFHFLCLQQKNTLGPTSLTKYQLGKPMWQSYKLSLQVLKIK